MSQNTGFPGGPPPISPFFTPPPYDLPKRSSGLAITSLILGILGVFSCCIPLFATLALIFGLAALPSIRRGEAGGRGVAIAGITLGVIGLILGIGIWVISYLMPRPVLLARSAVSDSQTKALLQAKILQADEEIEWVCAGKQDDVAFGGILLTDRRIVLYANKRISQSHELKSVTNISRKQTVPWFVADEYVLMLEDGKTFEFTVAGGLIDDGNAFEQTLRERVAEERGEPLPPKPSKPNSTRPSKPEADADDESDTGEK